MSSKTFKKTVSRHTLAHALAWAAFPALAPFTMASAQEQAAQGTVTYLPVIECPAGQLVDGSESCVTEVKLFAKPGIQQAEIDKILTENGWRMASRQEVNAAWESLGLHVTGFGKLSDGTYAVPAQRDVGPAVKRGVNFRDASVAVFSQGFFYVDATAPAAKKPVTAKPEEITTGTVKITDNSKPAKPTIKCESWQKRASDGGCASNVVFQPLSTSTTTGFDQARLFARERGWVIASTEEVRLATDAFGLNAPKAGYTSDANIVSAKGPGGFKVELGTELCSKCLTASPSGFFYLKEAEAGRVQALPGQRPPPLAYYPNSDWRRITAPTYANLWSNNLADQHPAKVLYGLGDARLLRRAAASYLKKNSEPNDAAATDEFLTKLQADPKLRYLFTPSLLGEAFTALSTPRPDATQRAFRSVFESYMSYDRYRIDGISYTTWTEFTGGNQFSAPTRNDYAAPASNLLPRIPSVDEFQRRNGNPMQISAAGLQGIRTFLAPAAYASLPEFRNSNFGLAGQDLQAIAAGVGVSATIGGTAATLGLVSSAVLGGTVVTGTTGGTLVAVGGTVASGAILTTTPVVSTYATVTPALLISKGTLAGTTGGVGLASSSAIAVTISVALAALIGKSFADLAKADQLSLRLNNSLNAGPQPVDAYAMINSGDAGTQQLSRTAVFSHLLKMLIAEPIDKGFLSVTMPKPPLPISGNWACGGYGKLFVKQSGYRFTGSLALTSALSGFPFEDGDVEGDKISGRIPRLKQTLTATISKDAGKIDGIMKSDSGEQGTINCTRDKPLGYIRLQSKEREDQFVHNETGQLGLGAIESGWWSAQWKIVPGEGDFVKFQNRFRNNEYLHIQNGSLQVGPLGDQGWYSAQWRISYLENGLATIQNRWKPSVYMHLTSGTVAASAIPDGATTGRWIIE